MSSSSSTSIHKSGLVIAVGTYDGVLAGWEFRNQSTTTTPNEDEEKDSTKQHDDDVSEDDDDNDMSLKLTFATAVHDGSIRSLCMAGPSSSSSQQQHGKGSSGSSSRINQTQQQQQQHRRTCRRPGSLLSTGYDETLKVHDWVKRSTSSGEIRTPASFGTPTVSAFAPPPPYPSTHCIVGFSGTTDGSSSNAVDGDNTTGTGGNGGGSGGKICIYKKKDFSVQHVMNGHEGGVSALAVHPTGKLAFSGGLCDGKLKLWDLTKGRLAFCCKLQPARMMGKKALYDAVSSIVFSRDGDGDGDGGGGHYAISYGSHVTVRQVSSGRTLLDIELPSRVHQVDLMQVPEGMFVVAACNDGSLPVIAVEDQDDGGQARRAIMAIEPVESHLAREQRFKCIQHVRDYCVVTANSAGVVSLMDLHGAVKMIMSDDEESNVDDNDDSASDDDDNDRNGDMNNDEEGTNSDDMEMAVDIIDSVRLGTGARITCLTAWCNGSDSSILPDKDGMTAETTVESKDDENRENSSPSMPQSHRKRNGTEPDGREMNHEAVKRARLLVQEAKKLSKKKQKKSKKAKKSARS